MSAQLSFDLYLLGDDLNYRLLYVFNHKYIFDAITLKRLSDTQVLQIANTQFERIYGYKSDKFTNIYNLINNPQDYVIIRILRKRFDDHLQYVFVKFTLGYLLLTITNQELNYVNADSYHQASFQTQYITGVNLLKTPNLTSADYNQLYDYNILPEYVSQPYNMNIFKELTNFLNDKRSILAINKLLSNIGKLEFQKFIDTQEEERTKNVDLLYKASQETLLRQLYGIQTEYRLFIGGIVVFLPNPSTIPPELITKTGKSIRLEFNIAVAKISKREIKDSLIDPILQPWAGPPGTPNRVILLYDVNGVEYLVKAQHDLKTKQIYAPI